MLFNNIKQKSEKMIKKTKKVETREVDGETIVFNPENNDFFVLNKTGTFVWKKINGKNNEKKIALKLAKKYGIPEKKALSHTKELIKKLKSFKLIKK